PAFGPESPASQAPNNAAVPSAPAPAISERREILMTLLVGRDNASRVEVRPPAPALGDPCPQSGVALPFGPEMDTEPHRNEHHRCLSVTEVTLVRPALDGCGCGSPAVVGRLDRDVGARSCR